MLRLMLRSKIIVNLLFFLTIIGNVCPAWADDVSLYYINKSQEYQGVTLSLYNLAYLKLKDSLKNNSDSAFTEQITNYKDLPVAIILDIDETILNTSAYAVYLEKHKQKYTPATWDKFLKQADAAAVPGAVKFIREAQSLGVNVFLVSNREEKQRACTIANLEKVGVEVDNENILLKNQEKTYTSNKFYRYAKIAKTHRIAMIVGDDLNDFFPAQTIHYKGRQIYFKKYAQYIGNSWIFIPNSNYGSFVDSATADLKEKETLLSLMRGFDEPEKVVVEDESKNNTKDNSKEKSKNNEQPKKPVVKHSVDHLIGGFQDELDQDNPVNQDIHTPDAQEENIELESGEINVENPDLTPEQEEAEEKEEE